VRSHAPTEPSPPPDDPLRVVIDSEVFHLTDLEAATRALRVLIDKVAQLEANVLALRPRAAPWHGVRAHSLRAARPCR